MIESGLVIVFSVIDMQLLLDSYAWPSSFWKVETHVWLALLHLAIFFYWSTLSLIYVGCDVQFQLSLTVSSSSNVLLNFYISLFTYVAIFSTHLFDFDPHSPAALSSSLTYWQALFCKSQNSDYGFFSNSIDFLGNFPFS